MTMINTEWAFARYEAIRPRLPEATFPAASVRAPDLEAIAEHFDGFILDAFGVLNVGTEAIPGAVARMARLRALGKRLVVLTNGATLPHAGALAKYRAMGFDFTADEVVSSRDVAATALAGLAPGALWAAAAAEGDDFADLAADVIDLIETQDAFSRADAFVLLSSARWTDALQTRLTEALAARPRPLVVANPDLVAPFGAFFSVEPGAHAHAIADALGLAPVFVGKPFPEAFTVAQAQLGGLRPSRIAMVGDTLHTDILGGRAAGLGTVLVAAHGLFAGRDVQSYIDRAGIVPDFVVETT
jgi:glycerol 3-phosphatase-2